MASQRSSPARSPALAFSSPIPPEAPKEGAVSRLLIAPLTFISFLLSLALIDSRNHSLRTHSHSHSRLPPSTVFGHVKEFLHSLVYQSMPSSPYSYIKSPNSQSSLSKEGKEKEEPWHWHTKQRHMMKAEMDDAFRVRKWVVVFLVACAVLAVFGVVGVLRWVGYIWRNWDQIGKPGPLHINRVTGIMYGDYREV
ncbi:uncharacterized protein K444DRAFT_610295 [Hyaloscypha bicolor E]|uniref:Uncharacterized protein n=1 Tax=Hyaloscypha bicolor E TaxID=1095630 RepID=A0A2J6TGP4_9HELO|nr:uncharacterized protein K444DRAFT_610295 [Hyaloscypha bicolor E]PMD62185.1 hypothetical protein K444DRAFT_610295 [Hyaloscypha bicolor E]